MGLRSAPRSIGTAADELVVGENAPILAHEKEVGAAASDLARRHLNHLPLKPHGAMMAVGPCHRTEDVHAGLDELFVPLGHPDVHPLQPMELSRGGVVHSPGSEQLADDRAALARVGLIPHLDITGRQRIQVVHGFLSCFGTATGFAVMKSRHGRCGRSCRFLAQGTLIVAFPATSGRFQRCRVSAGGDIQLSWRPSA
jgi:hypothetical protein